MLALARAAVLCAVIAPVPPNRLARTLGVSPAERVALVEALEDVTGEAWDAKPYVTPKEWRGARLVELGGCAPLDAQCAAEMLDEELEAPLLLVAMPEIDLDADADGAAPVDGSAPSKPRMAAARVSALVAAHEATWGLRAPIGDAAVPTDWQPERASLVAHVLLDGAPRDLAVDGESAAAGAAADGAADAAAADVLARAEWDVSEAAVWDGVVDEPLRAALLRCLTTDGWPTSDARAAAAPSGGAAGAGADRFSNGRAEAADDEACGPDPALWVRQLVDIDPEGSAATDPVRPGWSLRAETLRALCPPPIQLAAGTDAAVDHARPAAIVEFENRLRLLLPHCDVCFAPPPFAGVPLLESDAGDGDGDDDDSDDDGGDGDDDGDDDGAGFALDGTLGGSTPIVANAPQHGDVFAQHIDGNGERWRCYAARRGVASRHAASREPAVARSERFTRD
jgi:hypothetical protein